MEQVKINGKWYTLAGVTREAVVILIGGRQVNLFYVTKKDVKAYRRIPE